MKNLIKGLLISLLMISGVASAHHIVPASNIAIPTNVGYTVAQGDTFAKIIYRAGLKDHRYDLDTSYIERLDEINNFGDSAIYVGQTIYFTIEARDEAFIAAVTDGILYDGQSIGALAASQGLSVEEFLILNGSLSSGDIISYPSVELAGILKYSPWYLEAGVYDAYLAGYTGSGITISHTNDGALHGGTDDGHILYRTDATYATSSDPTVASTETRLASDLIIGGTYIRYKHSYNIDIDPATGKHFGWGTSPEEGKIYGIAKDATVGIITSGSVIVEDGVNIALGSKKDHLLKIADWKANVIHFATHRPIVDGLGIDTEYFNDTLSSVIPEGSVIVLNHGTRSSNTLVLSNFQLIISDDDDSVSLTNTNINPTIDFRDQLVIVGSYDNHDLNGRPNETWSYMDRYIMDSGYIGETGSSLSSRVDQYLTAAASARVAGKTALLKSKYSTMTGSQLANRLFVTADKDEGTFYEWTGNITNLVRSEVAYAGYKHGHGIINLARALSPVYAADITAAQEKYDASKCEDSSSTTGCNNEYTY